MAKQEEKLDKAKTDFFLKRAPLMRRLTNEEQIEKNKLEIDRANLEIIRVIFEGEGSVSKEAQALAEKVKELRWQNRELEAK